MTSDTLSDGRPRLDFLHGVRGLAALTVVLFHCTLNTGPDSARTVIRVLNAPLLHGYLAVSVFLVLSGFLLAVPVVTNGLALRGGIRGFMWRRSLRILPPYYAAYLLDMLFFAAVNRLASLVGRDPGHVVHHHIEIGYRWPSVVAHILLVHNMDLEWIHGMDGILWSIACEWQIYLLFAIVLVPLWRRAGLWTVLAVCAILAAVITEACARGWCVYVVSWMVLIFGLGVAGASVVFGTTQRAAAIRRWPWAAITLASLVILVAGICVLDASVSRQTSVPYYAVSLRVRWIYDVLAGMTTVSLIIWLTLDHGCGHGNGGTAARIRGFLDSGWLQMLSGMSYSVYLTHGIVLVSVARATAGLWPHRNLHWAVVMISGTLLSLVSGYVFHLCVESRFMTGETRDMFVPRGASPSAATSLSRHQAISPPSS